MRANGSHFYFFHSIITLPNETELFISRLLPLDIKLTSEVWSVKAF